MKKVVSLSGGKSSAYVAANYDSDHIVFALVRTEDQRCRFPDRKLAQQVEDRIQKPFVGTLEDDIIIYTIMDMEQYLGKEIAWVSGITFDEVVRTKGGWLPNKLHRYCTHHLKIEPIFYWWAENIGEIVEMMIGFRAGAKEVKRKERQLEKLNDDGVLEYKATFEKHTTGSHKGKNKWEMVPWQIPTYPMIDDQIYKDQVENYWELRPVRFARKNNCVHCFHQNPLLIRKQYDMHPEKIEWAASQEGGKNGYWRSDVSYENIINHNLQMELSFDDFSECDSGYCGL